MLRRRAVSETLRLHCSNTRWMCSQRTRSADIGLSRRRRQALAAAQQGVGDVVGVDRLGQIVDGAGLDRRDRGRDVAVAGDDHDPDVGSQRRAACAPDRGRCPRPGACRAPRTRAGAGARAPWPRPGLRPPGPESRAAPAPGSASAAAARRRRPAAGFVRRPSAPRSPGARYAGAGPLPNSVMSSLRRDAAPAQRGARRWSPGHLCQDCQIAALRRFAQAGSAR